MCECYGTFHVVSFMTDSNNIHETNRQYWRKSGARGQ